MVTCSAGPRGLWVSRRENSSWENASRDDTGQRVTAPCRQWERGYVAIVPIGEIARPCWQCEGTRPKRSKSKEALALHNEAMAEYQIRRGVSIYNLKKTNVIEIQLLERLNVSSEETAETLLYRDVRMHRGGKRGGGEVEKQILSGILPGWTRGHYSNRNQAEISVVLVDCDVGPGWPVGPVCGSANACASVKMFGLRGRLNKPGDAPPT